VKIQYVSKDLKSSTLALVNKANEIAEEYARQGYNLTLRQLYYQFVARGIIANKLTEYKRLGSIINDARLAGLIDWDHITDRTRNLKGVSHWDSPSSIINSAAYSFRYDKWRSQPHRVEVWVEKEALADVVEKAATPLDVDYFSCRGYVSQSELWAAAMRLRRYSENGQTPVIIHLGDHDPSGIDMTRDITDRMDLFGADLVVRRIALNMDQVQEYNPPPNPAKSTDSRFEGYVVKFGDESWELDALDPSTLDDLITQEVLRWRDPDLWQEELAREQEARTYLQKISRNWGRVASVVDELGL
jgi:hypothetical protein